MVLEGFNDLAKKDKESAHQCRFAPDAEQVLQPEFQDHFVLSMFETLHMSGRHVGLPTTTNIIMLGDPKTQNTYQLNLNPYDTSRYTPLYPLNTGTGTVQHVHTGWLGDIVLFQFGQDAIWRVFLMNKQR